MKQENYSPSEKKCYVITVLEHFPKGHPKEGEPTDFARLVQAGVKIHTVRGDYDAWAKKVEAVNRGEAYFSIRVWVGQPYGKGSSQREIKRIEKAGIQSLKILYRYHNLDLRIDNNSFNRYELLASGDGLSWHDFMHWVNPKLADKFDGAIIHFTNCKYR